MGRSFQTDIADPNHFVITLELVPGASYQGLALDTVKKIAKDAQDDGRVSAVTITDNPGGNPSLSPDVIGKEIVDRGMDVIVHFTCRDANRGGIESRALQLARMGMRNILALTGDYSGRGFGGQGMPVFDMDSTSLICFLNMLGERHRREAGPEESFRTGCAVSPFKSTEAETYAQYYKLCKKIAAGASFVITQVGYEVRKFRELLQILQVFKLPVSVLGSVYVLRPPAAKIMNRGAIPGAVVTGNLLESVMQEWGDREQGETAAIERAARLAVVLKGLGYHGIHVGGVHRSFATLEAILDRMEQIENRWREFLPDFDYPQKDGFYVFEETSSDTSISGILPAQSSRAALLEKTHFQGLRLLHEFFFRFESPLAPALKSVCTRLDATPGGRQLAFLIEDPLKKWLLSCKGCGDCGIQNLAFLCPESQCPKHIRNGACGGSSDGRCEVYPDRPCVWVRVYNRLAAVGRAHEMARTFVAPRNWALNGTSSWLNFHLRRDHQSTGCDIAERCNTEGSCSFRRQSNTATPANATQPALRQSR
ncbi:MAG: methylenetetrahydrofolate reductase C-terminal domain-containing protein [Desulfobacterales bacterium]